MQYLAKRYNLPIISVWMSSVEGLIMAHNEDLIVSRSTLLQHSRLPPTPGCRQYLLWVQTTISEELHGGVYSGFSLTEWHGAGHTASESLLIFWPHNGVRTVKRRCVKGIERQRVHFENLDAYEQLSGETRS